LNILISVFFILYGLLLYWLIIGWRKSARQVVIHNQAKPFVTVVVAMRNEALTITNLLTNLNEQDYPNAEVIVVDDHSDDHSSTVLNNWLTNHKVKPGFCKLIANKGVGKKAALAQAIAEAEGEIILTTDADCRLPATWISATVQQFNETTQLVVGPVRMQASSFTDRLQQLEFSSLIGSGAATLGWKLPTMANGANLAFRKSAFWAVNAYEGNIHIASGDDEFLMRKIESNFPGSISFNHDSRAIVETNAHQRLKSFVNQRIRWSSKWALHQTYFSKLLALLVFSFQAVFLLSPWLMLAGYLDVSLFVGLFLVKAIGEYYFFVPVLRQLQVPFNLPAFITLQFIYPYYVTTIGLLANVVGYQWKGRGYKSSKYPY
jgi:cellulose synthase/poly-beta-1,6-N-acetylglucosamine synthase-like glycosyltransferase